MTTQQTMTASSLSESLRVFSFGKVRMSVRSLKEMLPDIETALFFGKVYDLDYIQLSELVQMLFGHMSLVAELQRGDHSTELQDYLVEVIPDEYLEGVVFSPDVVPGGTILPELWAMAEIEVAKSLREVATKVAGTLEYMPGKEGEMLFRHMLGINRQRPTLSTYKAQVHHAPAASNLVIMDVSGSMTEYTVRSIVSDAVALSYRANAHFAIVSNHTYHWDPGAYTVDAILRESEFGGTYYETLAPLLRQNWGTVVTIADYDSSRSAKDAIRTECMGRVPTIEKVLDISLVNRPSFLAECVGQLAKKVQPLLIATGSYPLSS